MAGYPLTRDEAQARLDSMFAPAQVHRGAVATHIPYPEIAYMHPKNSLVDSPPAPTIPRLLDVLSALIAQGHDAAMRLESVAEILGCPPPPNAPSVHGNPPRDGSVLSHLEMHVSAADSLISRLATVAGRMHQTLAG